MDDYLAKPFKPRDLAARLLARRTRSRALGERAAALSDGPGDGITIAG
jgi:DNA-binding response OmpR family regulator